MAMKVLNHWFGSKGWPIGVDLGGETLKLAQVAQRKGGRELVAAASATIPDECRRDPSARIGFFQETMRQLLSQGGFRGRQTILSLPASCMYIERVRVPKMDDEQLKQAIQWELRGKLPIDPMNAVLRHVVAGDVYEGQEPVHEVIVMAADKEFMARLLNAAAKAKVEVAGMTAEPQAAVDCFAHLQSGTPQAGLTMMFVDMGYSGTRVYIARGPQMLFARAFPLGAGHFDQAVASEMKIPLEQARQLRRQRHQPGAARSADAAKDAAQHGGFFPLARRAGSDDSAGTGTATAVAAPPPPKPSSPINTVDAACAPLLRRLIDELDGCIRYHEATFPTCRVEQITFLGGEAHKQRVCQHVASALGLPGACADPLARFVKSGALLADLDPRQPQPAWTVAVGLSLGTIG